MRNLKFIKCSKLAVILCILIIISSSCKKDDEDSSGYYGKWVAEKVVPSYDGYADYIKVYYYLTLFSTNNFNESFYVNTGEGYRPIVNYVSVVGSFSVLENQMQFNAEKISLSNSDFKKEKVDPPFSVITNNQDIENTLNGFARVISGHNTEFSLNGNILTLSVDYNKDGDFLDSDEILIYHKQ